MELSTSVKTWAAARRKQVQQVMGRAAGIVRRQGDMQDAVQHMMHLSLETQV